ncbi:hypothetical protein, partial [Sinorhizobium psoraleae]|uniref:hypothetical protein n=1 Tax=Sinorhizobium psoraleae TaxID=520838 RepID=UPI001AED6C03
GMVRGISLECMRAIVGIRTRIVRGGSSRRVLPKARRTTQLCEHHRAIGFAADMVGRRMRAPAEAPRVAGIDGCAGARPSPIIGDLERNGVLDLQRRNAERLHYG